MNWGNNAKAYQLIEKIISNGQSLPLSPERAEAILKMKDVASAEDLKMLQEAVKKI